jgi:hypothetical protein
MDDNYIYDAATSTFGLTNIMQNYIASQFASNNSSITTNPTFIGNTNINNGVLSITGTSTNTGTIRIAPYNSGNESSIAFYRNYDYSQNPSFDGEKWVMGTNVYNGGQRVFAIGCDSQYACLTIAGTNGRVNAIKGLTTPSITLNGSDLATTLGTLATSASIASTYQTIASMTNYLTTATASSTYQPISSMSNYLTTAAAASTYQTIANMTNYLTTATASSTYQTVANMTNYINTVSTVNTDAAQNIRLTRSGNTLSLDYSNLMTTLGNCLKLDEANARFDNRYQQITAKQFVTFMLILLGSVTYCSVQGQ